MYLAVFKKFRQCIILLMFMFRSVSIFLHFVHADIALDRNKQTTTDHSLRSTEIMDRSIPVSLSAGSVPDTITFGLTEASLSALKAQKELGDQTDVYPTWRLLKINSSLNIPRDTGQYSIKDTVYTNSYNRSESRNQTSLEKQVLHDTRMYFLPNTKSQNRPLVSVVKSDYRRRPFKSEPMVSTENPQIFKSRKSSMMNTRKNGTKLHTYSSNIESTYNTSFSSSEARSFHYKGRHQNRVKRSLLHSHRGHSSDYTRWNEDEHSLVSGYKTRVDLIPLYSDTGQFDVTVGRSTSPPSPDKKILKITVSPGLHLFDNNSPAPPKNHLETLRKLEKSQVLLSSRINRKGTFEMPVADGMTPAKDDLVDGSNTSGLTLRSDSIASRWCEASYKMYVGSLYKLNCIGAEFEDASPDVRYVVPDVEIMRLTGANFQRFSQIFQMTSPAKVSTVYLEDSNVRDITDVFKIFDSKFILTLNVRNNSVEKLDSDVFRQAASLEYLDLSHNSIHEVASRTFAGAPKLKFLFLQNNNLSQLYKNMFSSNNLLQELHLDDNSITRLESGALSGLDQLMTLYLSDNNLADELYSHAGFFISCPQLRTLMLKNCQISKVDKQIFLGLENLFQLDLSWNRLTHITDGTFGVLTGLNSLNLENNQLTVVSPTWILPQTLKILSLANNQITEIEDRVFHGMDLSIVFLNSNKIETLPTILQMYLSARTNVTLSHNPWRCDCDLVYLIHHVTSLPHGTSNNITCAFPRRIQMSTVRVTDITCPAKDSCHQTSCSPCIRGLQRNVDGTCVCMEGTQPNRGQLGRTGCAACPALHYKPDAGNSPCLSCSSGSTPVSGPAPVCACAVGYHTNGHGDCEKCPDGTFKNYVGVGQCSPCTPATASFQQCSKFQLVGGHVLNISKTVQDPDGVWTTVAATAGVFAICVIVVLIVFGRHYHIKRRLLKRYNITKNVGTSILLTSDGDIQNSHGSSCNSGDFRCSGRHCLRIKNIGNMIGRGAFGQVYEGYAFLTSYDKVPLRVAVKRLKDSAMDEEVKSMRDELDQMLNVGPHPNIITLFGSVYYDGQLCIVMEYAELGDLLTYLKTECAFPLQYVRVGSDGLVVEQSAPQVQDNENLMLFAWQIAKGMRHLEMHRFIHRDLAARNCLLTKGPIAKVSDFGLSKDAYELGHYKRVQKDRVPFKWLSPEALLWGQYSSKSDVWAFGILLWELYTFGGTPYPQVTTEQLRELHENGYRMSKPPACPEQMYRIMRACWREDPRQRPSFKQLVQTLDSLIQKTKNMEYLYLHAHGLKTSNPLPFTTEDMDDHRTSLEFVYKNKKLNSYQSSHTHCEAVYDNMAVTVNIFNKHDDILDNDIFPVLTDVNDKTGDDVSNGSTVTSGFQSMSSAQTM